MVEPYLGEIRLFAGAYAPEGWAFCNGQTLPISQYNALYTLLGQLYGGNGTTTFGLPNLQGRVVIGTGTYTNPSDPLSPVTYALSQQVGQMLETVTQAQLPAHTHGFQVANGQGTSMQPSAALMLADTPNNQPMYTPNTQTAVARNFNPGAVSDFGGGAAHENRMVTMALNYIIATEGIYPSPTGAPNAAAEPNS